MDIFGLIIAFLFLGGWAIVLAIYIFISDLFYIPRIKKNLKQSIAISERIPADKITHFLSFYLKKAKELEPRLNKKSLIENLAPKGTDDSFWESILNSSIKGSAEQIIDKYLSHEKYSHQKQLELKLKKCFIPE